MLAADERLIHPGVALRCRDADKLLSIVIDRAADVGVRRAREEFPLAEGLVASLTAEVPEEVAAGVAAVCVAVERGLPWLAPTIEEAIRRLAAVAKGVEAEALEHAAWRLELGGSEAEEALLLEARRLSTSEWVEVWAELPHIADPIRLSLAAERVARHATIFDHQRQLARWAGELSDLLDAVRDRGPESAIHEHRMVLVVRRAIAAPLDVETEQARRCSNLAVDLLSYYERTGATWVLPDAIVAARVAVGLTERGHPDYAQRASNLGSGIALAIQAGIIPAACYAEAITHLRQALQLIEPTQSNYTTALSNLGGRILEAIWAGALSSTHCSEAIGLLRQAVERTDPSLPDYANLLSDLGGGIWGAIRAGFLPVSDYLEALNLFQQALENSDPTDPVYLSRLQYLGNRTWEVAEAAASPSIGHSKALELLRLAAEQTDSRSPEYASRLLNFSLRVAQSVEAGVLPLAEYSGAVELLRVAVRQTGRSDPLYPELASTLGAVITLAIREGALPVEAYAEAVPLLSDAVQLTDTGQASYLSRVSNLCNGTWEAFQAGTVAAHQYADVLELARRAALRTEPTDPQYPMLASNLGNGIANAIRAGILPAADYAEAVGMQRQAVQRTQSTDRDYPGYASNLGNRIAHAIQAGILPSSCYAEAVDWQRQAVLRTERTHRDYPRFASNLGNAIWEAIHARVLQPDQYGEAIELLRQASEAVGLSHPDFPAYGSNLSNALADAIGVGMRPQADYAEAVTLVRQAVERTGPSHPDRPLYLSNLGCRIAQAAQSGVVDQRESALEIAAIVEELWRAVRQVAASPLQRRAVLEASQSLVAWAPAVVAFGVDASEGIRTVESLRNHLLDGLHAPVLPPTPTIPVDMASTYYEAARHYEQTQQLVREGIADLRESGQALASLLESVESIAALPGLEWFGRRPRLQEIAGHLADDALAVYLVSGPTTGLAILLDRTDEPELVELPDLTQAAVATHINRLLKAPAYAQRVLAWMWAAAIAPLPKNTSRWPQWVIVPTGHLGLLPWHAAGDANNGWLDDTASVRVIPSLMMLRDPTEPAADGPPLVGIAHDDDLGYLEGDRIVTAAFLPDSTVIPPERMTVDAVLMGLINSSSAVLSGHAQHSLTEGGGLVLVDGVLSAESLHGLPVLSRDIIVLSSCSSGQIASDLADESIGLPNALMHAGFRGVCGALWPIGDRNAFIALAKLLQIRRSSPSLAPHEQLREVRRELRTATTAQLQRWVTELVVHTGFSEDSPVVRDLRDWLERYRSGARPLDDPADWAVFAYFGR